MSAFYGVVQRHNVFLYGPVFSRTPNFIYVSSTTGMQVGDTIQIMLDSGVLFKTQISLINADLNNPTAPNITITPTLPGNASAGNIVIDLTQSNNVAPVTASDIV